MTTLERVVLVTVAVVLALILGPGCQPPSDATLAAQSIVTQSIANQA